MSTISIDFDGVIHAYREGWQDGSIYDKPVEGAFEALRELMKKYSVVIFTSRDAEQVADWLFERGDFRVTWEFPGDTSLKFWNTQSHLYVTNRKLPSIAYIDDRGIRFYNWAQALATLENFHG